MTESFQQEHSAELHRPADAAAPSPPGNGWGWTASLQSLASTIVIALFVITFSVQAFQIPTESMERTLLIGDYLLVDKTHFAPSGSWSGLLPYREVRRGEILVFRYPLGPEQHFVKRVIGLPGDHIRMRDAVVFVNDRPLSEPYTQHVAHDRDPYRDDFPQTAYWNGNADPHWRIQLRQQMQHDEVVVPQDSYFVMGDNRDHSLDSRYWGFVPRANLVGRPLVIYFSMDTGGLAHGLSAAVGATDDRLTPSDHRFHIRWERMLHLVE